MKTPITDKAFADAAKVNPSPSLMNLGIVSRRLELDRAALMEALEAAENLIYPEWHKVAAEIRRTIDAARANFPD